MRELHSRPLLVAKGLLFGVLSTVSLVLLMLDRPNLRTATLLAVLVWSCCRLYYFVFYVLEKYVDPRLRYAGLFALVRAIAARRRS